MSDRAQAYTLEAVVGALIITSSVVFALNATVLTPSTTGEVSPEARDSLRQQATDILATTADNETFDLSTLVRYWDPARRTFYQAQTPDRGYGSAPPPKQFGTLLRRTFTDSGRLYNVEVVYLVGQSEPTCGSGSPASSTYPPATESITMVQRGTPPEDAVVATHTTTLFDNQTLTADQLATQGVELCEFDTDPADNDDGYYPIPDADPDGPLYNVVRVRVIVW
jgi:hypothetical protein